MALSVAGEGWGLPENNRGPFTIHQAPYNNDANTPEPFPHHHGSRASSLGSPANRRETISRPYPRYLCCWPLPEPLATRLFA